MLSPLPQQPEDQILRLIRLFAEDPRPGKIDLGVGVYRNAQGQTPVMRAVKAAERQLWDSQQTKSYTALTGDAEFHAAMSGLVLGDSVAADRIAAAASVGGTGALHTALELVRAANPQATIWLPDPTWPNHAPIAGHVGLARRSYRYFDAATGAADPAAMLEDLATAGPGDVVLLHGCCHNPTGADLALPDWQALAGLLARTGATPLIDLAYQGFGDGIEADAAGTRLLAAALPEVLVAASCSKNFGLYRERAGILLTVTPDAKSRGRVQQNLAALNRMNFSFPPDHGARLVGMILSDPDLRADWQEELDAMRAGIAALRRHLAAALRDRSGSDRFGFLAENRGMFSRLGASPDQVEALRRDHGIYMVGDSRMNIAGLTPQAVPRLAEAILAAGI
ncbi:amino acid aminotransferase [Actibacterium sp. MT2.3-13A]|uniref:amino acid aminotransferase n=1 Tax=Actibacterium sp. MT2.3-13A TaxID=2828332 RepID=UPI001BA6A670|nr:amino acid aminotransferase [Actibacterium sp. MT2.3-13A]